MRKVLLFSLLALCVSNVFANMHATGWRWRNDNGTETTATWKAADTIGITVTDTISLLRLRFRYDNYQGDPKKINGISYSSTKPAGDFSGTNAGKFAQDGVLTNGIILSNAWGTNPFVFSTSALVANGTATTQGQVKYMNIKDIAEASFFAGIFKSKADNDANLDTVSIPAHSNTEFEYCFKPTKNLVPGATYYFFPKGDIEGYYDNKESAAYLKVSSPLVYAGISHAVSIKSDGKAYDLNGLLSAVGAINPSTITWSVATAPAHGNVAGLPATSSFTGTGVTPSELSYTPTTGYKGSDQLIMNVSDGTNTTAVTFDFTLTNNTAVMSISANKPNVYPNPTTGLVNFDVPEGNVSVIGLNGQVILQTSLDKSKTIDISNFASGIYILYLKTKDAVYEYKIVRK